MDFFLLHGYKYTQVSSILSEIVFSEINQHINNSASILCSVICRGESRSTVNILAILRFKSVLINLFAVDSEYFTDFTTVLWLGDFFLTFLFTFAMVKEFCFCLGEVFVTTEKHFHLKQTLTFFHLLWAVLRVVPLAIEKWWLSQHF